MKRSKMITVSIAINIAITSSLLASNLSTSNAQVSIVENSAIIGETAGLSSGKNAVGQSSKTMSNTYFPFRKLMSLGTVGILTTTAFATTFLATRVDANVTIDDIRRVQPSNDLLSNRTVIFQSNQNFTNYGSNCGNIHFGAKFGSEQACEYSTNRGSVFFLAGGQHGFRGTTLRAGTYRDVRVLTSSSVSSTRDYGFHRSHWTKVFFPTCPDGLSGSCSIFVKGDVHSANLLMDSLSGQ